MLSIEFIAGMLALGTGVGLVSAALGVGGGILMVPAFVTVIQGMDVNTAKGSSLFIIAFVAALNSWRMNRGAMKSPWEVVGLIVVGSAVGGYLGAWTTSLLSDDTVTWIFITLIGFAAFRMFFLQSPTVREEEVRKRRALSSLIGLAKGTVAGATGTGGGAIFVPLALWAGIASNERVVALSNTVMVVSCSAGALAHFLAPKTTELEWTYGLVNVSVAPLVFIGAIASAPLGRRINAKLSLRTRRIVMGSLLLTLGLRFLIRVLS